MSTTKEPYSYPISSYPMKTTQQNFKTGKVTDIVKCHRTIWQKNTVMLRSSWYSIYLWRSSATSLTNTYINRGVFLTIFNLCSLLYIWKQHSVKLWSIKQFFLATKLRTSLIFYLLKAATVFGRSIDNVDWRDKIQTLCKLVLFVSDDLRWELVVFFVVDISEIVDHHDHSLHYLFIFAIQMNIGLYITSGRDLELWKKGKTQLK